jgi:hypothetical protein
MDGLFIANVPDDGYKPDLRTGKLKLEERLRRWADAKYLSGDFGFYADTLRNLMNEAADRIEELEKT